MVVLMGLCRKNKNRFQPLVLSLLNRIICQIVHLEETMSALDDKVAALATAEQDLATRVGQITAPVDALKQQLADLQTQFDALTVDDTTAKQELADALADAAENVDKISAVTDELGGIAPADPSV